MMSNIFEWKLTEFGIFLFYLTFAENNNTIYIRFLSKGGLPPPSRILSVMFSSEFLNALQKRWSLRLNFS